MPSLVKTSGDAATDSRSAFEAPGISDPARKPTGTTSFERGLEILDLLIELETDVMRRSVGLSVQQVASELGVHRSSAYRLMQTLVANGYAVRRHDSLRRFSLGPAVQVHSGLDIDQRRLREAAHPFLTELVDATGECAHASVALGAWALVVDDAETGQPLRVVAGRGRRVPLHCTSAGKCLLAFGLATIPRELPARTPRTLTNPEILRLHLADIVERGYAVDDEEHDPGVRCISAPVFNAFGEAIGCIGIDGPSVRVTDTHVARLADHVMTAAERLSTAMSGHRAADPSRHRRAS